MSGLDAVVRAGQDFSLGGIGTATFGAIILNAVMSLSEPKEEKASGEPIELDRKA